MRVVRRLQTSALSGPPRPSLHASSPLTQNEPEPRWLTAMREEHLLADATARERALDITSSFIVQAPAGSGKTDLLVKRYIKLLDVVEKPEEILAITFTIKAAAEMRQRVLEKIDSPGTAHRLGIQTIDAFCTGLTRQMPVLSRFGAQPAIVEEAGEHYR